MALLDRPRARSLLARLHRATAAAVAPPIDADPLPEPDPPLIPELATTPAPQATDFARELAPGVLTAAPDRISHLLYERLDEEDVAEIIERVAEVPALSATLATATTLPARRLVVIAFGLWLGVAIVPEKTGLTPEQPPEDVHAMARGPLAAAGGLYEADMIADALASAGVELADVRNALDFGSSSGRVLRVLKAAHPDIHWSGCDPNGPAIEWAGEHLPGIDFFISGDAPPLTLPDESLDLAYAISIWSHFEPALGLRWFEEMHRVIRPGGHLVCTTHGWTAIAHYALGEMRTPEQSREIADALYRQGWWYAPEFGEEGDWGVVNPDWGTAFLSPEWILTQLCPRWQVLEFAPGRNQENQDVYVLRRV